MRKHSILLIIAVLMFLPSCKLDETDYSLIHLVESAKRQKTVRVESDQITQIHDTSRISFEHYSDGLFGPFSKADVKIPCEEQQKDGSIISRTRSWHFNYENGDWKLDSSDFKEIDRLAALKLFPEHL